MNLLVVDAARSRSDEQLDDDDKHGNRRHEEGDEAPRARIAPVHRPAHAKALGHHDGGVLVVDVEDAEPPERIVVKVQLAGGPHVAQEARPRLAVDVVIGDGFLFSEKTGQACHGGASALAQGVPLGWACS